MNIVFLSPHFPGNYYNFCVHLHEMGATVLGIADEKYENLHPNLTAVLTEYYQVSDMHDYDQLVRAVGYFTYKYGKIDCFESHTEYWLETDARIRTDFNIPGIQNDEIAQIKYKSLMKKKFIEANVDVVPGKVVGNVRDAEELIKEVGYPVVAKPDSGVGAAGTYKIKDQEDLIALFANNPFTDYFMEKFIHGTIYTFDGLVDRYGQLVFCTSHTYSEGTMETVNGDLDTYYYSLREIPQEIEKAGRDTLTAFDVRERFFHFEFFKTVEGKVVGLEVNMRPPGGFSMDMFNFANDINLYSAWGDIVLNGTTTIDYTRKYYCAYFGRKFNKEYIHSHEEILDKFGEFVVLHEPVNILFSVALGNYGYVVRSPEVSDIFKMADFIHGKR